MPKGWRTELGPRPDLGAAFGLVESEFSSYPPRTKDNMRMCDVTILIARNFNEAGTALTKKLAFELGKPVFEVTYPVQLEQALDQPNLITDIHTWLHFHKPAVINIAGNRESKAPGIEKWTCEFIRSIFIDTSV